MLPAAVGFAVAILTVPIVLAAGSIYPSPAFVETTITVKEACDGPIIDSDVVVKDQAGNVITETAVGTQVSIEGTVFIDCVDYTDEEQRLTLFEVRTKEGITTFIAWQTISEYSDGQIVASQSWTPDKPGKYEVRLFSPVCLRCPMVLSNIVTYEITVV